MLCPRCMQREANVFFTKNVNGKKEEYKVCDVCAKEMGLLTPQGVMVSMNDFISQFMGKGMNASLPSSAPVCPKCHTTLEEFAKTSKFGCGECYHAFENYLDPMMKRMHGTTGHSGKLPSRASEDVIKKRKIDELKAQLNAAVQKEDFEQAAVLRDKIKQPQE